MRIGIFTVSMPECTPQEAIALAAELGYEGLEWRCTSDTGDGSKPSFWSGNRAGLTVDEVFEKATELKSLARKNGLAYPALGTYIDCHNLDAVDQHMRAAVAIGAKALRIGPGRYVRDQPYSTQLDGARRQYEQIVPMARSYGLRAVVETHMGQLCPSVAKAVRLLDGLPTEAVGIMWDPANQVAEGLEDYAMALDVAGDYLHEVHCKNLAWLATDHADGGVTWKAGACPIHRGVVDWRTVLPLLKSRGYDGWLFLEDFSTELPLKQRLAFNIKWLRDLLAG